MDEYTSHELAYQNGYSEGHEKGYKEGFLRGFDAGKQDAMKWIPVTERLPDVAPTQKTTWGNYTESIRVLCACLQADGKRMVKEGYCKVYEGYEADPHWKIPGTIHSVTHWMPLPEPPKGE